MSDLSQEHDASTRHLAQRVTILAATLIGLGVIFGLAANWDTLGHIGQFILLQTAMLACGLSMFWRPQWRTPMSLLLLLLTGGLLALVGQTYQTGADPWQLFALWSLLSLPLTWCTRHDALWAAWVLVSMTALSLWLTVQTKLPLAWALSWLIVAAMSPTTHPWTGAGIWSQRLALTLTAILVTFSTLDHLFDKEEGWLFGAGVLTLTVAAFLQSRKRMFDLYGLSALMLCLNVCLMSGLGHWLLRHDGGSSLAVWFLLALMAAGLLTASVKWVMHLSHQKGGAA